MVKLSSGLPRAAEDMAVTPENPVTTASPSCRIGFAGAGGFCAAAGSANAISMTAKRAARRDPAAGARSITLEAKACGPRPTSLELCKEILPRAALPTDVTARATFVYQKVMQDRN